MAARRQANPVRSEFVRDARFYEEGDALFRMVNDSRQLLWFLGRGADQPSHQVKGTSAIEQRNPPLLSKDSPVPERFPLAPGEIRYFNVSASNAQPVSIGVHFYTSRTGTNGFVIWSEPVTVQGKRK